VEILDPVNIDTLLDEVNHYRQILKDIHHPPKSSHTGQYLMQVNIYRNRSWPLPSLMLLKPFHQPFLSSLLPLQDNNRAEKVDQLKDNADNFAEV